MERGTDASTQPHAHILTHEPSQQSLVGMEDEAGPKAHAQSTLSLLDSVDVAEQSRILCAIQDQQLYLKQCLTSKKRQMTLGAFVAPKRVK